MDNFDYFEADIESFILDLDRTEITKKSYKKVLTKFSNYLKFRNICEPKTRHVIEYKNYLDKTLAPISIQKVIVVLRVFFRYEARNNKYNDITVGISFKKITKVMKRDHLTRDNVIALIDIAKSHSNESIDSYRNYVLICVLATTGLRTIEIERSEVTDLDKDESSYILYVRGKGRDDKSEYVKLSDEVYGLIETYLSKRNDSYLPLFITHGHNSYGEALKTRSIREIIKNFLLEAGLENKNLSAHSLRHFLCSEILRTGGTLEEAQQVLRHRDISTTQIYNHSLERSKNDSEIRVSNLLFVKKEE